MTFEFHSTYSAVSGEHVGGLYIPTVEHSDILDVVIDHVWHADSAHFTGWAALTGHTCQHGYSGAVMHPSETADDETVRGWVREAGGDVFAIVEVTDADEDLDEPIGWAVIYRAANKSR